MLLVIACPCALVVSTPVTVVSGLAAGARQGILIKGGAHLEAGQKLRAMALDKTGTLTEGRPALTDCEPLGRWDTAEALQVAASLDEHSSHPVARAVVNGWRSGGAINAPLLQGQRLPTAQRAWRERAHRRATLVAGQPAFEWPSKACSTTMPWPTCKRWSSKARRRSCCSTKRKWWRCWAWPTPCANTPARHWSPLRSLGVHTVMLSGDNPVSVGHVGRQLGLADARGGLLPQDKLDAIAALKASHGSVAMVGDGVNDAPAMAPRRRGPGNGCGRHGDGARNRRRRHHGRRPAQAAGPTSA